ncbi:McrB family protein [Rouxiella chamberiensis]|uniref:McrB family protein n=1 Tax=Rouxiella chamberiensis TaxID=1513468 RepID=UPI0005D33E6C|nr:AAA family ATPase [Rouxiella chamberiensis]
MSRFAGEQPSEEILSAASQWKQHCLLDQGSLFSNSLLWNSEYIAEIELRFINSELELTGKFLEQLEQQLRPCSAMAKKLAAELFWLLLLCPDNINAETKRVQVAEIWSWSGETLIVSNSLLKDNVLNGVGSGGVGYNSLRYKEFVFEILVIKHLLALSLTERQKLLNNGFEFAAWLKTIPESETRQFRHMLLFLLFPDDFERIFGGNDRRSVIKAFSGINPNKMSALEIDKQLLEIRREQQEKYPDMPLDFYVLPLSKDWQKTDKPILPQIIAESVPVSPMQDALPINLILFGPPGTGKTFELNLLKAKYVSTASTITREQWLTEQLAEKSWCDVVFMALWDLGGKAKVSEIKNHEFIAVKAAAQGRTQNLQQTMWSTLQQHAAENSDTVKYARRTSPYLFDKREDSSWFILPESDDECVELVTLSKSLKLQPDAKKTIQRYEFVTFHQAYSYEDFVEGIRPELDEESGELSYSPQDGVFRRICHRAEADPENRYAIFIDEINRGNVAKIFGELITLIEIDKRLSATGGMQITLPYSRKPFGVPDNLDIYGTMNTADRSISLLDTALRRRFQFKELMPNADFIAGATGDGLIDDGEGNPIHLRQLLEAMNQRIRFLISRDLMLGHAYLCKVKTFEDLKAVFLNQFIPLLQEYFYDDWNKIQRIFKDIDANGALVEAPLIGHIRLTSKDVFGFTQDDFEDVMEYKVSRADEITPDSIRKIYASLD